jgi:hypothetical protein
MGRICVAWFAAAVGAGCASVFGPPLPRGAIPAPEGPGRFAGRYEVDSRGGCSQSWAEVSWRSAVVLDLDDRGGARMCRALDYHGIIGGWEDDARPQRTDRHERQAMRGTWRPVGSWLELRLKPVDDASCAAEAEPPHGEPGTEWHLMCVGVHTDAAGRLLACRFETRLYVDEVGYTSNEVLTSDLHHGDWILLGSGDGVILRVDDPSPALYDANRYALARAASPIDPGAGIGDARNVCPP